MEQMSLFSGPQEKGSSEWASFNAVRVPKPGMFRVASPIKAQARETVVLKVRPRHGNPLFPKPAH